jgi:hypothetical protein
MRITKREVKQRQDELAASGHTKADVQRLASVSERMVYFWYRGEKTSAKVAAAHRALANSGITKKAS